MIMTLPELKKFLYNNAGFSSEEIEEMDNFILLDNYLKYHGIFGFTDTIIEAVKAIGINNL